MPLATRLALAVTAFLTSFAIAARPDRSDMRGWVVAGKDSAELVMATACHRDTPAIQSRVCDKLPPTVIDSLLAVRRIRVPAGGAYSIHFVRPPLTSIAVLQNEDASIFHRFMTDDLTWYAPEKPGFYPLIVDGSWSDRSESRQRFMFEVVANTHADATRVKPDTTAEKFFLRTIAASKDGRVDRVPSNTEPTWFRVLYRMSDSLRWRKYDEELLRSIHGRPSTNADQYTVDISITDLYMSGDTLIGRYSIGDARRCGRRPWEGGAATYEMRALRIARGWSLTAILMTGIGDTFGCPNGR